MDIQVAVGEILQNIIRFTVWKHRHEGRITISLCPDHDGLKLHILDGAVPGQCDDWDKSAEAKQRSSTASSLNVGTSSVHFMCSR